MKINPDIFKAYDIRGKFPRELNESVAEQIGKASALYFAKKSKKKKPQILVATDLRISSPALFRGLVRGLISQGADVLQGGEATTPYFYFLLAKIKPDGGIMVTASHSPAEYNGFKLQDHELKAVSLNSGLEVIRDMAITGEFKKSGWMGEIKEVENMSEKYLDFVAHGFSIDPIKVVVDVAGGAETLFIQKLLNRFPGIKYKPLYFSPDGSFSKHSPNPTTLEGQKSAKDALQSGEFRCAAIFDGDSDRVIFLDEKGQQVRTDFIFALLAETELKKKKGLTFATTLNTSKSIREYVKEQGGNIVLTPQGYPFLQKIMRQKDALIGVELSGHFHFKKAFFRDSTLIPFLGVLQYLSKTKEPLSRIVNRLQRYISSQEIAFEVRDKQAVIEKIKKIFSEGSAKLSFLDGVTVEEPDWWFNLRAANTESVVRLALEAKNEKLFEEKMKEIKKLITA